MKGFNIIFGNPETWLANRSAQKFLKSSSTKRNLVCLVVDEVHKVTWGESSKTEAAFRESFSRICELRSTCRPNLPVLAMSATVNVDLTGLVMSSIELSKNVKVISSCSDRPNIKLNIINIKDKTYFGCLRLIYCRSVDLCGRLYIALLSFFTGHVENPNDIIKMYHAYTSPGCQNDVLESLCVSQSTIRIILCTSALECGVHMKNVRYVLHYGPSNDVVDYCQQIGRAGRNTDEQCHAIFYQYANSKRNVSERLKNYMSCNSCLRTELFTQFNEDNEIVPPLNLKHSCCSNCAPTCDCPVEEYEVKDVIRRQTEEKIRNVSEEERDLVKDLLNGYVESMATGLCIPPEIATGLNNEKILKIVASLEIIASKQILKQSLEIIGDQTINKILEIVNMVFNDLELEEENTPVETERYFSDNDSLASAVFTDTSSDADS
ncbi:bifunctional 3'-5' exonuclease/ATP-dependent helicase WRN-like [Clytia hemisphaerica]|uniref:bifunctional 3'-5' exonuclease/ATP-dependent helicase WRN-like n=1 Tax=Clytia hemisphaerica TaxID=252671 RepID=UPI0034D4A89A